MIDNKTHFQCFIDGKYETHMRNQMCLDGRRESWATEAELHAASALYEVNIKVTRKLNTDIRWLSHIFRANGQYDNNTALPYANSIHLILKNNHFNLLQNCSVKKYEALEKHNMEARTDHMDWFELKRTMKDQISYPEPVAPQKEHKTKRNRISGSDRADHNDMKSRSCSLSKKDTVVTTHTQIKPTPRIENVAVTNLSQHPLTESQVSLLSRGLKFIPDRHKVDKLKLLADLAEWERRMRLKEFFYVEGAEPQIKQDEKDPLEKFKVPKKSSFTPNKGCDMWLDMYIEMDKTDIINSLKKLGKLNISPGENDAFLSLLHNDDIVIRPADKGSGIVVLDKTKYVESLQAEMEESNSYTMTEDDQTKKSMREVKKLVNQMYKDGAISQDMKQFLIPRYSKAGSLKGNPKLHKDKAPLRTIVNGMNTATEKIAELAEYELNEFVITSPSYIRDTTDFINTLKEIEEPLPQGTIMFCFDVCKLYPSVPKQEGLEACREGLNSRSKPIVPTEEVLKMIEVILDNNNFNLGNMHYIQTNGIAIGSKLGKNFACSYMRKWDEKLMEYHEQPFFL